MTKRLEVFAFTYRILWSNTGISYYGVRYSQNCSVNDLWTTYFTSSKHVQQYRELHGEPDIIEIRKTFTLKADALRWESLVLKRLKIPHNEKWLNKIVGGKLDGSVNKGRKQSKEVIENRKKYLVGKPGRCSGYTVPIERRERISTTMKHKLSLLTSEERKDRMLKSCLKKSCRTKELHQKISNSLKGRKLSSSHVESMKLSFKNRDNSRLYHYADLKRGSKWFNNGNNEIMAQEHPGNGWMPGRLKRNKHNDSAT